MTWFARYGGMLLIELNTRIYFAAMFEEALCYHSKVVCVRACVHACVYKRESLGVSVHCH